jgi:rubrerythrin
MRLIDADALKTPIEDRIDNIPASDYDNGWNNAIYAVIDEIDNAPTVELNQDLTKNNQGSNQGDLISREALKNYARKVMYENNATNFSLLKVFDEIIDNAPTVETSKIEHKAYNEGFKDGVEQGIKLSETPGEWIEDSGNIACSHCHTIWLYRRTDFCPNCGAKMQKEGKEE